MEEFIVYRGHNDIINYVLMWAYVELTYSSIPNLLPSESCVQS